MKKQFKIYELFEIESDVNNFLERCIHVIELKKNSLMSTQTKDRLKDFFLMVVKMTYL